MYLNSLFLLWLLGNPSIWVDTDCGQTLQAKHLAQIIIHETDQQRPQLRCNAILSAVASAKAKEMASKQFISHSGQGGPNRRLRAAGYPLPEQYPKVLANQVESIAGGNSTAPQAWQAFKDSTSHRLHLLADHPFYLHQNEIGVGFVHDENSYYEYYWVVYIAGTRYYDSWLADQPIPDKGKSGIPVK